MKRGQKQLEHFTKTKLYPGEQIIDYCFGSTGGTWRNESFCTGILLLTNVRLAFCEKGWFYETFRELSLTDAVSFTCTSHKGQDMILVSTVDGRQFDFRTSDKKDFAVFLQFLRQKINDTQEKKSEPYERRMVYVASSDDPDPIEQIKQLDQLRQAGILTEQEFAEKKQELLDRL